MTEADLPAVSAWLERPHVARWWTPDTTPEREAAKYRDRIVAARPRTHMLVVELDGEPVGWCQWYRWADYPAEGTAAGAADHEAGIDYAIGEPAVIGQGVGTAMVGALVEEVRRIEPAAGLLVTPEAANTASRRVLEHNGFALVEVRPIDTEAHDRPMAIYRRESPVSESNGRPSAYKADALTS
jgi:aminoglycoside 6'-N-acetyltransferase